MSQRTCRLVVAGILVNVAGCSALPDKIESRYVSGAPYNTYSCDQVDQELTRVGARLDGLSDKQRQEAWKDQIAMVTGFVFPFAWLLLPGKDHADAIAQLKGERSALQGARFAKCSTPAAPAAAPASLP